MAALVTRTEAFGIVLTDSFAHKLKVSAYFRRGNGELICKCKVTQSIRVVLYATMEAVSSLESYIDGLNTSRFATHDLIVDMDSGELPIDGESYGLPLSMAICGAMLRRAIPSDTCFTGVIAPGGNLLPVEDIDRKRALAASLGFRKLVLPSRQLDFFNTDIAQCPVDSLFAAIGGQFWD